MALLLNVRQLASREDAANLVVNVPIYEPASFRNPTFVDDFPTHPGAVRLDDDDVEKKGGNLPPSDSGIHLCVEDAASVGGRSLDSGVFEPHPSGGLVPPHDTPPPKEKQPHHEESLLAICIQVFVPFLVAGIGTCGAGLVLDRVEEWEVFQNVSELFILVPTLLGLKGNLEMTLASRVSTQANLGKLDSLREQWQMSWGNMALVQCQATVMGLLASCFATGMSAATGGFDLRRALLLGASALVTASMASFVLGAVTLIVVILSHRLHINPDNVATPIAASLGDVTTLGFLAAISSYLYSLGENLVPASVMLGVFAALAPVWALLALRNPYVRRTLFSGWAPVLLAVVITSAGGYILEFSVSQFRGFAIFQPVINGVAGNLVAVQASRISTHFHKQGQTETKDAFCPTPWKVFCGGAGSPHARTARILLSMVVPGHLLFGYGITLIKGGDTVLTPTFLPIYLAAALIQVTCLLYAAQCLVSFLWRKGADPDDWAIPLLTAMGDLSGMVALTLAFVFHASLVTS